MTDGRSIRVLCSPALLQGFTLAGVPSVAASGAVEAAEWIERMREQPEVGVILVEQVLYDGLPERTQRVLAREPLPVIVPFPGPAWTEREMAEAHVLELLRRAIGYRVRLR